MSKINKYREIVKSNNNPKCVHYKTKKFYDIHITEQKNHYFLIEKDMIDDWGDNYWGLIKECSSLEKVEKAINSLPVFSKYPEHRVIVVPKGFYVEGNSVFDTVFGLTIGPFMTYKKAEAEFNWQVNRYIKENNEYATMDKKRKSKESNQLK